MVYQYLQTSLPKNLSCGGGCISQACCGDKTIAAAAAAIFAGLLFLSPSNNGSGSA